MMQRGQTIFLIAIFIMFFSRSQLIRSLEITSSRSVGQSYYLLAVAVSKQPRGAYPRSELLAKSDDISIRFKQLLLKVQAR
jgi:hypothetical protein